MNLAFCAMVRGRRVEAAQRANTDEFLVAVLQSLVASSAQQFDDEWGDQRAEYFNHSAADSGWNRNLGLIISTIHAGLSKKAGYPTTTSMTESAIS